MAEYNPHKENAKIGQVIHIQEFPQRASVPPAGNTLHPSYLGLMEAANKGWQHMTVGRMVIIIWPVQIGRHNTNVVSAVLPIQELTVLQTTDFGQGISLVGFLQL